MVQVQNIQNYGTADVPQDVADKLGANWQAGGSLVKPPFQPPWESQPTATPVPVPGEAAPTQPVDTLPIDVPVETPDTQPIEAAPVAKSTKKATTTKG